MSIIRRGRNRFVALFPKLVIVIKLPRISITLFKSILNPEKEIIKRYSIKVFFAGVVGNWREFLFYQKTHHCFLQPTYFSFLGLINLQRAGKECADSNISHKIQMAIYPNKTNKERLYCVYVEDVDYLARDMHHWGNSYNFSFWKNKLYIHDYGSLRTQKVILKFGETIFKNFS